MNVSEDNESMVLAHFYASIAGATISFLFSLSLNGLMVYLIVTGADVAGEFFGLNLAVSETIIGLCSPLFIIRFFASVDRATSFFSGFFTTGRPLFLCCISVERYIAVLHPVPFRKYRPLRYRLVCAALLWPIVLSSCLLSSFMVSILVLIWVSVSLPLFLVKVFSCLAILRALRRPRPGSEQHTREGSNRAKVKAFKIISVILMSEFLTYSPLIILTAIQEDLTLSELKLAKVLVICIMTLTGLIHPFLYLRRAGKMPCATKTSRTHRILQSYSRSSYNPDLHVPGHEV